MNFLLDIFHFFVGTILPFVTALGILVFVHEWGHYIVAKLSGVWVQTFSLGFGKKIFHFHRNGTDYQIAPIPLGGYVKLYGQEPWEEAEGDPVKADEIARDPRSFYSKPIPKKLATVLAGPFMNLVLSFTVMPFVFMVGIEEPKILHAAPVVIGIDKDSPAEKAEIQIGDKILAMQGKAVTEWRQVLDEVAIVPGSDLVFTIEHEGQKRDVTLNVGTDTEGGTSIGVVGFEPLKHIRHDPLLGNVAPNSPAEKAGLRPEDLILSINDTPIPEWKELQNIVRSSDGKELKIVVERKGKKKEFLLVPEFNESEKRWQMGAGVKIADSEFVTVRSGFVESLKKGTERNLDLIGKTFSTIGRLVTGNLSVKALGGPVQIAQATAAAAENGLGSFFYILAFLSLQLGILNLLPVPVLDGGHAVIMLIELVIRRPLSPKIRQKAIQVGMIMLLSLMGLVIFNDLFSLVRRLGFLG